MMIGAWVDNVVLNGRPLPSALSGQWPQDTRLLSTAQGLLRVRDNGGAGPVVLMVPDGPSVLEHFEPLFEALAGACRLIVFDMPGFGYSRAAAGYSHRLEDGAAVTLSVMDALGVAKATLAYSCANGYYALHCAQIAPERIERLVLCQTPSFADMKVWTRYVVPSILSVPVLGQAVFYSQRKKMARLWFDSCMPKEADKGPLKASAGQVIDHHGCFCLASLVQGLAKASDAHLNKVRQPVTVIWGDKDRTHKYSTVDSLKQLVPQARIERYQDCGHLPNLEQPGRFAAALRQALSS